MRLQVGREEQKVEVKLSMERTPFISVENVSKSYGQIHALRGVSFQCYQGEIHALVGQNGAGKSTLMGIISGSVTPDQGRVLVGSVPIRRTSVDAFQKAGIRILHQNPALEPDLSVGENIQLLTGQRGLRRKSQIEQLSREVLGIWSRDRGHVIGVDTAGWTLTPAQRTVIALCAVVWTKPLALILDEPTEHLQGKEIARLFEIIEALKSRGVGIIYISHRLKEVEQIADRVTVIREGEIQGTFDEKVNEETLVELVTGLRRTRLSGVEKKEVFRSSEHDNEVVIRDVRYGDGSLRNIEVPPGQIIGVTGASGANDGILLRQLAGLDAKRSGTAGVCLVRSGVEITSAVRARRNGIQYVGSDRVREGIFPGLSIGENLVLRNLSTVARGPLLSPRVQRDLSARVIDEFSIKPKDESADVGSLSGGNQQKVVIGGALSSNCKVLLLDEPTQGVDVGVRQQIHELLRERARVHGMRIIIFSADFDELIGLVDRILVISRGEVVSDLSGSEITERSVAEALLTGSNSWETAEANDGSRIKEVGQSRRSRVLGVVMRHGGEGQIAPASLLIFTVALIGGLFGVYRPLFVSTRNISDMLLLVLPFCFAAFGEAIVLLQGGFDLSIGPLMGLDLAIASFYMTSGQGSMGLIKGLCLMVLACIGVAVLNWSLIEFVRLNSMIATLVTYVMLEGIFLTLRPIPKGLIANSVVSGLTAKVANVPILFTVAVALGIFVSFLIARSSWGWKVRAIGSNERIARLLGVRVRRYRLVSYLMSAGFGLLGALALVGQVGYGDPSIAVEYTLAGLSAAIIGGVSVLGGSGGLLGPLMGALLLTEALSLASFVGFGGWFPYVLSGGVTIIGVLGYSLVRKVGRRMILDQAMHGVEG